MTDEQQTNQESPQSEGKSFVSHAITVSAITLASRLLGLLRDSTFAWAFGLSSVTNAFYLAFTIPNLFRRLFGDGALSAAFIPIYSQLMQNDRDTAKRLASLCIAVLVILLSSITVIGEMVLLWLGSRSWSDESALAIRLTMIMLPYMPLICLVALIGGVLQVHKRFAIPAAMPLVLNICLITSTLLAARSMTAGEQPEVAIIFCAAGVLVAGVLQFTLLMIAMMRVESMTRRFEGTKKAFKTLVFMMVPMVIGLAVIQINVLFDRLIAFSFAPKEGGEPMLELLGMSLNYPIEANSISAISWSQRLYQFPLGVFGIALATAIFPALAGAAARIDETQNIDRFRQILRQGLQLTMFIGLPASVGLIIVRLPLTRLIFEYGKTDLLQTVQVSTILVGYASGAWAYSMIHVLTRAFYALKDSKTPLVISVTMVFINLALNLTLIWYLGAAGLAWSTAACAMMQVVLLIIVMRRHVKDLIDISVFKSWGTTFCLTVLMACALEPLVSYYNPPTLTRPESAILLAVLVVTGVSIYVLGAWKFNSPELDWLLKRKTD